MFSLITPILVASLPGAYEVDFSPLANLVPPYEYTLVLGFKGEEDLEIPCLFGKQYTPTEQAETFMETLRNPRWKLKQEKEVVAIYGYDDVRILKVSVKGKDARPLVRWVPFAPQLKKK